tara:strand:+ start:552 stop:815 length:264 start_codon:yes stop_codon:yes gene_type:complete
MKCQWFNVDFLKGPQWCDKDGKFPITGEKLRILETYETSEYLHALWGVKDKKYCATHSIKLAQLAKNILNEKWVQQWEANLKTEETE